MTPLKQEEMPWKHPKHKLGQRFFRKTYSLERCAGFHFFPEVLKHIGKESCECSHLLKTTTKPQITHDKIIQRFGPSKRKGNGDLDFKTKQKKKNPKPTVA